MQNDNFIGVGQNPNGPDLPLGFGLELEQSPRARSAYSGLTNAEKEKVIRFIQSGVTGDEAKNRIISAVQNLAEGNLDSLLRD